MAETRRFELLKALTPYLVSSEAHSTGQRDVLFLPRELNPWVRDPLHQVDLKIRSWRTGIDFNQK